MGWVGLYKCRLSHRALAVVAILCTLACTALAACPYESQRTSQYGKTETSQPNIAGESRGPHQDDLSMHRLRALLEPSKLADEGDISTRPYVNYSAVFADVKGPPCTATCKYPCDNPCKLKLEEAGTEDVMAFDGLYHNPQHPTWGFVEGTLYRRLEHGYRDGVREPAGWDRPNPRVLSEMLMNGTSGFGSYRNRTAMMVYYAQQLVEEIMDSQVPACPLEYFNIPIPKCDKLYDPDCTGKMEIPFPRLRYDGRSGDGLANPREITNEITPWLDGGLVYGTSKAWCDALRSFKGGRLLEQKGKDGYPAKNDIGLPIFNPPPPLEHHTKPSSRLYRIGNPRGSENPYVLSLQFAWFRLHNWYADYLASEHPNWNDERLFQRARQFVVAVYQNIMFYEFIPAWLGPNLAPPEYTGFDGKVFPGIPVEFQSAAMRFGHTLVSPGVFVRDKTCKFNPTNPSANPYTVLSAKYNIRTCNVFFNSPTVLDHTPIESIIMGMASQRCEREDNIITPDLREFVYGPLEFSRRDLMALNIQRGRDTGLPDFNHAREAYGLPKYERFEDITKGIEGVEADGTNTSIALANRLRELYNDNIDNIDVWVGGLLETTRNGPGELFGRIMLETFTAIRNGDRWWFENRPNNIFSEEEIAHIRGTKLSHVFKRIDMFGLIDDSIQENVFQHNYASDPCPQPIQLSQFDFAECTPPKHRSYFPHDRHNILGTLLTVAGAAIFMCFLYWYFLVVKSSTRAAIRLMVSGWVSAICPCRGRRAAPGGFPKFESRTLTCQGTTGDEDVVKVALPGEGPLKNPTAVFQEVHSDVTTVLGTDADLGDGPGMTAYTVLDMDVAPRSHGSVWILNPDGGNLVSVCTWDGNRLASINDARPGNFLQLRKTQNPWREGALLLLSEGPKRERLNRMVALHTQRTIPLQNIEGLVEYGQVLWIQVSAGADLLVCGTCVEGGLGRELMELLEPLHNASGRGSKAPVLHTSEVPLTEATLAAGLNGRVFKSPEARTQETDHICEAIMRRLVQDRVNEQAKQGRTPADNLGHGYTQSGLLGFSGFLVRQTTRLLGRSGTLASGRFASGALDNNTGNLRNSGNIFNSGLLNSGNLFNLRRAKTQKEGAMAARRGAAVSEKNGLGADDGVLSRAELAAGFGKTATSRFVAMLCSEDAEQREDGSAPPRDYVYGSSALRKAREHYAKQLENASTGMLPPGGDVDPMIAEGDEDTVERSVSIPRNRQGRESVEGLLAPFKSNAAAEAAPRSPRSPLREARGDEPAGPDSMEAEVEHTRLEQLLTSGYEFPDGDTSGSWLSDTMNTWRNYVVEHRILVVWITIYFLMYIGIFTQRFYSWWFERERRGMRYITGFGISVAEGATGCMTFSLAILMVFVCNHILNYLSTTFIAKIAPVTQALPMHKIAGSGALFAMALHSVAHVFNFYFWATQPTSDLNCYFRELYLLSDEVVSFVQFWVLGTSTGLAGFMLVVLVIPFALFTYLPREKYYRAFLYSHDLFFPIYMLALLHGAQMLLQKTSFHWFFFGPFIPTGSFLFMVNWIIGRYTTILPISVIDAEHLPGETLVLTCERPKSFHFRPGQYARVKCNQVGTIPHPFYLSSSPNSETLEISIRAVGPWTRKMYELFDPALFRDAKARVPLPPILVDGPFGRSLEDFSAGQGLVLVTAEGGIYRAASVVRAAIDDAFLDMANERLVERLQEKHNLDGDAHPAVKHTPSVRKHIALFYVASSRDEFDSYAEVLRDVEERASVVGVRLDVVVFVDTPHRGNLLGQMLLLDQLHMREQAAKSTSQVWSLYTGLAARVYFTAPNWSKQLVRLATDPRRLSDYTVACCGPRHFSRALRSACAVASTTSTSFTFLGDDI